MLATRFLRSTAAVVLLMGLGLLASRCAAGAAGVGTVLLYEDDHIKVWDMELQPGETAPLHQHEFPYVFTVLVSSS